MDELEKLKGLLSKTQDPAHRVIPRSDDPRLEALRAYQGMLGPEALGETALRLDRSHPYRPMTPEEEDAIVQDR